MPYKCNVCGKIYAESSPELRDVMLRGSCSCGKKFLMYIRKEQQKPVRFEPTPEEKIMEPSPYLPQPPKAAEETKTTKPKEEKEPLDWLETNLIKITKSEEPMYLSIETIKILEEGKYQIDITSLMSGKPIIVKDEAGVYYIDVPYAMKKKER